MIYENIGKIAEIEIFKRFIKNLSVAKIKCLVFFKSARRVCNHLNFKSIKMHPKRLLFKKVIFAFLNPKIVL